MGPMRNRPVWIWLAAGLLAAAPLTADVVRSDDPGRTAIALEALSRLKGMDLEANPALKTAVLRVLDSIKGSPQFVEVVRDFKIKGQEQALLEFALLHPSETAGAEAGRLILETDPGLALVSDALKSPPPERAISAAELLGNTKDKRGIELLKSVIERDESDLRVRKRAAEALAQTQEGASWLLALAHDGKLPNALKLAVSTKLSVAPWPAIRQEAAQVLPLPQVQDASPLPAVSELVKRIGNVQRGAEIFSRPTVACASCHRVGDHGIDFGPNLSEIGTKLGKDALYEAILDPSAGISFGFEAWEVVLRNGDEIFGLLASETSDEIAIKTQNGLTLSYKKSDVIKRNKLSTSIMPAGLQQSVSVDDLIDLVEYLASLRAKP